jgi:thymidylate synthase
LDYIKQKNTLKEQMNNLDIQYQNLLKDILENGTKKTDRTGTGTISVFGRQIRHKMSEGFPLLTTKKMSWKTMVTELLWFLQGRTDLKYLLENGCHIWTGDAYKVYDKDFDAEHPPFSGPFPSRLTHKEFEEKILNDPQFEKMYGDLGPIYGKQWRSWVGESKRAKGSLSASFTYGYIDQIQNLIEDLKTNPDSRRLMVNAWNVGELDQMTLPPCHYGFQVYTRELSIGERLDLASETYSVFDPFDFGIPTTINHEIIDELYPVPRRAISLMWNQRSVDTFLGLPFNIASYGLLLEIIAKEVNMVPDELIGSLGDVHLYSNHIEQAKEQIGRKLTDEERYNIWFNNNYETGMERFFDPNNLPDFDNPYYVPTPKKTREPYPLPKVCLDYRSGEYNENLKDLNSDDFVLFDYKHYPQIKAPLSN